MKSDAINISRQLLPPGAGKKNVAKIESYAIVQHEYLCFLESMILVRTQPPALANPIHQIPLAALEPEVQLTLDLPQ